MEKVLSGKPVAQSILDKVRSQIASFEKKPVMALLQAGTDPSSAYYVQNIIKQGNRLGMEIQLIEFTADITTSVFSQAVDKCNTDKDIDAIMIQKPLPKHIDEDHINNIINPLKDVDGISPRNLGKLFLQQECYAPCTAKAVIELIKYYNIEVSSKNVVIIGRSSVVGKPLLAFLLHKAPYGNATVTVCHSQTKDIDSIIRTGDIVIAAIGKPNFVKKEMIKEQAICIDVGINVINDSEKGEICVGDFDYQSCYEKSAAITPVPGGIGTITTSILLNNLLIASVRNKKQENS